MKLLKIDIETDGGPWAKHNMPCPIDRKEYAVLDLESGVFLPSWKAQREGWMLIKAPGWLKWFLKYLKL